MIVLETWFSNFNYYLDPDKSSPKYLICKSWNSLPYNLKSEQPDDENISTIATMRDALMETVGCVVIDFAECPPKYKINNTLNKENNFVSLRPSFYKFPLFIPFLFPSFLMYRW